MAPAGPEDILCARLCVLQKSQAALTSALAAVGVAACAPGAMEVRIQLQFCAVDLAPSDTVRLAVSSSYFPMCLHVGAGDTLPVAAITATLPSIEARPISMEAPPDHFGDWAPAVRRLRHPVHARRVAVEGERVAVDHTLDDGTVLTADGLAASARGVQRIALVRAGRAGWRAHWRRATGAAPDCVRLRGRRGSSSRPSGLRAQSQANIRGDVTFESALVRGDDHALVRVTSSLETARARGGLAAVIRTVVTAVANGRVVRERTMESRVPRLLGLARQESPLSRASSHGDSGYSP